MPGIDFYNPLPQLRPLLIRLRNLGHLLIHIHIEEAIQHRDKQEPTQPVGPQVLSERQLDHGPDQNAGDLIDREVVAKGQGGVVVGHEGDVAEAVTNMFQGPWGVVYGF